MSMNRITNPTIGFKFIHSEVFGRNFSQHQTRDNEIANPDWAHDAGLVRCYLRLDPKLH